MATQTPLAETINDFWRMVLQHKSSTIVMLNQLREGYEVGEPALPDFAGLEYTHILALN